MRPLDELRSIDAADVFKGEHRAGTLVRGDGPVRFTYDPGYLRDGGVPVATTLPLGPDPVAGIGAGAVPPFFAGLLPEGRRLAGLQRAVKTSADDELTVLLAVGGDTIGDVRVVPQGETPAPVTPVVEADDWPTIRFDELLVEATGGSDRTALPGIQDKLSAGTIAIPLAGGSTRAILKLDPPEYPHLVANEAFFLEAARTSGIDAARASVVHDATGRPGLLVARFDRLLDGGAVVARAQEDACQVLGRYPADKYRVSTEDVLAALAGVAGAPLLAARDLVRQVAFAYLIGNGDAHAKNFSVVRVDDEWRVTPAYDVLSTHPYGDHTMALPVHGKQREDIGRDDVVALGASVGLPARAVERTIDELLARTDAWVDRLDELPFDERCVARLRASVTYRRDRLRPASR
jgi:serine/threonine-protein kinase HipA